MGVGGSGGNQALLFALGATAMAAVPHGEPYWSLQRRHPEDEHRWLDLAHYLSKGEAESALERVVENAHADRHELRVEQIRRKPTH
jgi:hypothetical protein